jgi:hypothetical protein
MNPIRFKKYFLVYHQEESTFVLCEKYRHVARVKGSLDPRERYRAEGNFFPISDTMLVPRDEYGVYLGLKGENVAYNPDAHPEVVEQWLLENAHFLNAAIGDPEAVLVIQQLEREAQESLDKFLATRSSRSEPNEIPF